MGILKTYFAHSKQGYPSAEWEPLEEHLQMVAEQAFSFAVSFESDDWAYNAGILHDIGKATQAFQSYLARSNGLDDSAYDNDGSVSNHASSGAAIAEDRLPKGVGRILAYLIAGHHAGLPDWYASESGSAALKVRLEEGRNNARRIPEIAGYCLKRIRPVSAPSFICPDGIHLWIRMMYSALVDADFLATESFIDPDKGSVRSRFSLLPELLSLLEVSLEKITSNAPETNVNRARREVLESCLKAAEWDPGIFSLTVPTGGGKTLSSTAFALKHAILKGKNRIIYVIPYTSIIEQTGKVLSGIFGEENVIEHHSGLDPERETQRSRLASENWDAPVIVTTSVQFFESFFAANSSRCRKLHNIANSVVILDEVQLIPVERLVPCVDVLNRLANDYGASVLLSTATQPALSSLPEEKDSLVLPREIVPKNRDLFGRLKRVKYEFPEDLQTLVDWVSLAGELRACPQVLCIVNRRRDCRDLFLALTPGEEDFHLSALMCGEHRAEIIEAIRDRLVQDLTVRVVSTQLVEAGVDLDFPVVYRAFTGFDSIAQAAGRCNREGKNEAGSVRIFVTPRSRGLLGKREDAARDLFKGGYSPEEESAFKLFFGKVYSRANDLGGDWLHDRYRKDAGSGSFDFRTGAKEFRFIEDGGQRTVFVRWKDSEANINALRSAGPRREILRKLQRYSVSLSVRDFDTAKRDGLIEEIADEYWVWAGRYDERIGLDLISGRPLEDYIQ